MPGMTISWLGVPIMTSSKARYESFLVNNVSTISTLESSLRSITWLLPGRFKDAELASETLTSLLNVMSMYHDTLLARIIKANPSYRPLVPFSLHSRFTRAWSDKDVVYKWAARVLEFIRFTELVSEMLLRRKVSEKSKWRLIVILEVVKATLRMLLLRITHRPLVTPPIPERDIDPSLLSSSGDTSSTTIPLEPEHGSSSTPSHLQNNHAPLSYHPILSPESDVAAEEFLLPKALTTDSVRPSISLVRSLSGPRDWLAETVYILRPLVYACLLAVDSKAKKRSNRALIVALTMELLSRSLRRSPPSSALERAEYARRDKDIFWYFLRGPIWENYTRLKIESFVTRTSRIPLVGLLGVFVKDWIPLINDYYYYTAP